MDITTILIVSFLLIIVVISVWVISTYNRFINLKNGIESTLNQINVALKKRLDMINGLVEATKSYTNYERNVFIKITELRTKLMNISNINDLQDIDKETKKILGNIIVQVENYPNLKTSETVSKLMESIKDVEDEIARLRYTYNNIVQEFNTMTEAIPSKFIASIFGFKKQPYLELEESLDALAKRPMVSF